MDYTCVVHILCSCVEIVLLHKEEWGGNMDTSIVGYLITVPEVLCASLILCILLRRGVVLPSLREGRELSRRCCPGPAGPIRAAAPGHLPQRVPASSPPSRHH